MIVALAGGVGAAKFLRGLLRVVPAHDVTVIVNTADDIVLHGLHISPDLDTITYSLAGAADFERGWGLAGETWNCLEAMGRYEMPTWFRLGDRDIATHLFRTTRMADGLSLSEATSEIAEAWEVESKILPMTNDPVANRVVVDVDAESRDLHFQEYMIERGTVDPVERVYYGGIEHAHPLADALDALLDADGIVFCPSNPVVSIGPILAIEAYRDALERRAERAVRSVGVSPIIRGAPVRGPADKLMPAAGLSVDIAGVATAYRGLIDTLVIDDADSADAAVVADTGISCVSTETLMTDVEVATSLAGVVVDALGS